MDDLVKNLPKHKFSYTKLHLCDDEIVLRKGVFPYEYFTGPQVMKDTHLPPKQTFYSKLKEEDISDDDYVHAQHVWDKFECKTLKDYHDIYLKLDVLLLADVFENFRSKAMGSYGLDPLHYLTLPSFSWHACLRMTRIKLDLNDPEHFLMVENNIRGGISVVSHRYAKANNPYNEQPYDPSLPTSYLTYVDANNLYGHAMRQPLPIGKFQLLQQHEIDDMDDHKIRNIPENSDTGYIFDVDLDYPTELHSKHNDYPCAPEQLTVTRDMLSQYSSSLADGHPSVSQKLAPNLQDKRNYVLHYRNLQLYMRLGLKCVRVHRVLAFKQTPWLREYIDFNTKQRKNATNEFEKDFYKLMNNAVFGKTMESLRNRVNVHLVMDPVRFKKLAVRPTLRQAEIINHDLVMVKLARPHIIMEKPIYVGFCVLELSKVTMYEFHYDHIVDKYGQNARLLYTDTDSFIYHIQTEDLYDDMARDIDIYDTSNFDRDHPLFSERNNKVVGKFKCETGSVAPCEFVGLRSKMYSLLVPSASKPKLRAKGVKKSYVKQHVTHLNFLETLRQKRSTPAKFQVFRSRNHVLNTVNINKVCLTAYDDKRYILEDGITTLAYGHENIH